MVFRWFFRWFSGGFQVVFRWFSGGFQVVFRWFSGGFQVVFRWFSGGFQVVSRCVGVLTFLKVKKGDQGGGGPKMAKILVG